jgi:predicted nucleic acid-binding Zn ribbon protein
MAEAALSVHDNCGGELRRLLYPVGIVFKGSGFHVNDYGKNGRKSSEGKGAVSTNDNKTESKTESKTDTGTSDKSEATSEAKTESKVETAAVAAKAD